MSSSDPSEICGSVCQFIEDAEAMQGNPGGRRLYIHQDSLRELAAQSSRVAQVVYGALVSIPVVKLAFHDLSQDAVLVTKELSAAEAERLTSVISKRWYTEMSCVLRRIAEVPRRSRVNPELTPLLGEHEWINATCFDANYYTFATSELAAQRMFADFVKLTHVRTKVALGDPDFRDLTMIWPRKSKLVFMESKEDPTSAATNLAAPSLSLNQVEQIKQKVAMDFESELRGLMHREVQKMSDQKRAVVERFINRCIGVVRRTVLALPDQ